MTVDLERTLVFIKPDAIKRKLVGEIIKRFELKGFEIVDLKKMVISPELSDLHYKDHLDKSFYPRLKAFITSGPVIIMILEGRNAVDVVRKMIGSTDSGKAEAGTIRGDYSLSETRNIIHASDSAESALREIKNFFA